jgi:hypothetical protein
VRTLRENSSWFEWTGSEHKVKLVEFCPKREQFDLFQNVSCKAISESKFACNTNISLITEGPVSQYQFKYQHKDTQGEDTVEYAEVDRSMKLMTGRVHEDDKKEAVRLICRAAFAHNSKNVIGAPMANYLVRNGLQFYFSHSFAYCPLQDIMKLHARGSVDGIAKYTPDGKIYFENAALHYLCHNAQLDGLSAAEFYSRYEVIYFGKTRTNKKKKRNAAKEEVYRMENDTGHFIHPSAKRLKNGTLQQATQAAREKNKA